MRCKLTKENAKALRFRLNRNDLTEMISTEQASYLFVCMVVLMEIHNA